MVTIWKRITRFCSPTCEQKFVEMIQAFIRSHKHFFAVPKKEDSARFACSSNNNISYKKYQVGLGLEPTEPRSCFLRISQKFPAKSKWKQLIANCLVITEILLSHSTVLNRTGHIPIMARRTAWYPCCEAAAVYH